MTVATGKVPGTGQQVEEMFSGPRGGWTGLRLRRLEKQTAMAAALVGGSKLRWERLKDASEIRST